MKLYELSHELALIHADVEEAGGELSTELEARLDGITMALEHKATSIGQWVLSLKADEAAIDGELARLKKMKQARINLQDRLKAYVMGCMDSANLQKITHPTCPIRIQRNSQPTLILNPEKTDWPSAYCDVVPEHLELNKATLKTALADGAQVEGAQLYQGSHLRIG